MVNKIKKHKKNILIKSFITLLMSGVILFALYHIFHKPKAILKSPNTTPKATNTINYGPPTQQEKDQASAHKDALAQQYQTSQAAPPPSSTKQQVTPVITNASQNGQQVTVTAYISGIFENDGVCTASFTHESLKVVKTSPGTANASTTDCAPFRITRTEFSSAGDWQVSVAYSSAAAGGVSSPRTFTLQ